MMYAVTSDDDELVFEMMPASSSELTGLVAQLHRQSEPAVAASSQSHVALMPRAAVPAGAFTVASCACGQLLFCPLRATDMQQVACNVQLQMHPIPPCAARVRMRGAACRLVCFALPELMVGRRAACGRDCMDSPLSFASRG